ncbi:hypothetical protein [Natrinema gari]|nr:hypothetical protein [Natrinema gari]
MHRRKYLIDLGGALTAGAAGYLGSDSTSDDDPEDDSDGSANSSDPNTPQNPSEDALQNTSFEEDLTEWTVGKDLPTVPGESSDLVEHSASVASQRASDGDKSLGLYIKGVADDGTIWVEQTMDGTVVEQVTVDVYSEMNSANRMSEVAFFAGAKPDDGLSEADFNRDNDIEDHSGWKTYSYSVSELSGEITLAIGMNVVWENDIKRFFDNVTVVEEE